MTPLSQVTETYSPVTYGASVFTIIAGLTINEWVAIGGLILGLATFALNWWYKHKTWAAMYKQRIK